MGGDTFSSQPRRIGAAAALELGHHDSRVTFAHYRELVKPKEATRFWQLKPAGHTRKIVQMMEAR
jgi:hypothetical protein